MPVGSIIELYTTMLGWYMYDALWGLLTGTGLVLAPFAVAIIQTLIKGSEREEHKTGDFVKALEIRIYTMLAVMIIAAQPLVTLQPTKMVFNDVYCEPAGTDINLIDKKTEETIFDDAGNTAGNASNRFMSTINGSVINIPLWWYVVSNLSNAVAYSLKMELPCNPDFRLMTSGISNAKIKDPKLLRELEQFQDDCWKKAVVTYLKDSKDPSFTIPNTISNVEQDISWLGSRLFLTQAQYYPSERSSTPNEHLFWRETVDGPAASKEQTGDRWIPFCHEWWSEQYSASGIENGLRERTLDHIKTEENSDWLKWLEYWAANATGMTSTASLDDYILLLALKNDAKLTNGLSKNYEQQKSFMNQSLDTLSDIVAYGGIFFKSIPNRAEANTYRAAAPVIQALIIMLFVMFLPLLMNFMLFDIGKVLGITVILFSVIFWGYLFELAEYIDNYLISSLISGFSDTSLNEDALAAANGISSLGSNMSSDDSLALSVLKWISRMSYILIPAVFTGLLGMVGFNFSSAITGAIGNMGRGSANAASSGASQAQSIVSGGVRKAGRR
ncbi:conjugal transfer protein TraG N-terminal domain-containing protein [Marinagarivorans cellulosilyticus]|uniref:TraG N-terminal Proteobacteria domain-containing protein n=1 Tax=Marinagarivorans cellulosilyticus TaxID=2721545 RepID=A0AAN1WHK8_9GAMM|nr:conjugal transfer protein TraG N-terminal domain-containing protein [Marinagarivorans cellulosilyticus]BCD97750.1 hypothetical protein MARGE09_P1951 [Marinagarivorans cellulosilyticus]